MSLAVCLAMVFMALQVLGCGETEVERKQKEYESQWKETMTGFQQQGLADDKKANQMVEQNDISGLITLINQRITDVNKVIGQVLEMHPPEDLWKLYSITLYYLTSLRDQLESQNDLNEAALAGKPTEDLKSMTDSDSQKTQIVGAELGVEMQKVGIKLDVKGEEEVQNGQDQGKPEDKQDGQPGEVE